ncbi:ATP-binding protein [Gilvimarinus sp. SDUM040013]|uniref:histidine kinase n=1 Tax=Gilvimarinus gilvus TaxID=3058038 RepID=A0ABU4RUT5_9GAMM|nr:sensor histidine kinase [Gilvimarinus sp. SDUM040013]MDO3388508.1 ATP-binding protein [Gilvimarinus sp. SDUM040013]MDX6848620.1 CHASE3 domain-containing protein [Gilvimarinus sp. SDUM040013]
MTQAYSSVSRITGRTWGYVLILVVIFFLGSMGSAYRSIGLMHENNLSVGNTLRVMGIIRDLKMALVSAESGKRGYLLTEDGQYLAPYHAAMEDIDRLVLALGDSHTEIDQQQERFQELDSLIAQKVDRMQEKVQLVHLGRRAEAVASLKQDVGVDLMRKVDRLFTDMEADETALLERNREIANRDRESILIVLLATNGVGLLLAIAIFIYGYRHARKLHGLYRQIESANDELEQKVADRTFALQQYSEELQRSNRELEEFAFIASHDLQEPLRKIRAFGDRLKQKYSDALDERGADYIDRMHAASARMSQLIDDLLSFSRVTTRQEPFEKVDLNQVVSDALEDLEYAIDDSHAKVTVGELPTLAADASQLRQVFMNLLSNSIKFRKPDITPEISITCELTEHADAEDEYNGQWWSIAVVDNGIGFEDQYSDKVFNLFQRLHGRGEYKGTGIGLALCRKIVERHNGTIIAISEPGQGTEFRFSLPTKQLNLDYLEE